MVGDPHEEHDKESQFCLVGAEHCYIDRIGAIFVGEEIHGRKLSRELS
jgi:hypothetical protein